MFKALLIAACAAVLPVSTLCAEDSAAADRLAGVSAAGWQRLGFGQMFVNDALGDGRDRWRTASYFLSSVVARDGWTGSLPATPFTLLEWRLRAEIISPADLVAPDPGDRRYAGVLAPGLFTHFDHRGLEASLGAELAITGAQTGLGAFHREVHEALGLPDPQVLGSQIGNGLHPTLRMELGRSFDLGDRLHLRPFAEAQAGIETYARIGTDLVIGHWGAGALMLRDTVTGFRTEGAPGSDGPGTSLTLGADVARLLSSDLLPEGGAAVLSDTRARLRLGLNWQGEGAEVFYGLAWLGPEYDAQSEGQTVGALRLRLKF